jgi:hypothetical protein
MPTVCCLLVYRCGISIDLRRTPPEIGLPICLEGNLNWWDLEEALMEPFLPTWFFYTDAIFSMSATTIFLVLFPELVPGLTSTS